MHHRHFSLPLIGAVSLAVNPLPRAEPSFVPVVTVTAPASARPSQAEFERLLRADPLAALKAARDRVRSELPAFRATLLKHERVDGVLQGPEEIDLLVRERPYAVRMLWRSGARKVLGTAVEGTLYVAGENGGKMTVWRPSALASFLRHYDLAPGDSQARAASRYSVTEASLTHTIERTVRAWSAAAARGAGKIEYLGREPLADAGGRACHVLRRTCEPPEGDRFLMSESAPSGDSPDAFATATVYIDSETWCQVGAEMRRADGELVGRYVFRDVQVAPPLRAGDFTKEALRK